MSFKLFVLTLLEEVFFLRERLLAESVLEDLVLKEVLDQICGQLLLLLSLTLLFLILLLLSFLVSLREVILHWRDLEIFQESIDFLLGSLEQHLYVAALELLSKRVSAEAVSYALVKLFVGANFVVYIKILRLILKVDVFIKLN